MPLESQPTLLLRARGPSLPDVLYPTHQNRLDIRREGHTANDCGKQVHWGLHHQVCCQLDRRQVIVQKGTPATMERVATAADPRRAQFPGTETSHVVPLWVSHEHIGTMIIALRMAFQPSSSPTLHTSS